MISFLNILTSHSNIYVEIVGKTCTLIDFIRVDKELNNSQITTFVRENVVSVVSGKAEVQFGCSSDCKYVPPGVSEVFALRKS